MRDRKRISSKVSRIIPLTTAHKRSEFCEGLLYIWKSVAWRRGRQSCSYNGLPLDLARLPASLCSFSTAILCACVTRQISILHEDTACRTLSVRLIRRAIPWAVACLTLDQASLGAECFKSSSMKTSPRASSNQRTCCAWLPCGRQVLDPRTILRLLVPCAIAFTYCGSDNRSWTKWAWCSCH